MKTNSKVQQLFPSAAGGIELFDEFFDSGLEESVSPFLTPDSREWGRHLSLKSSIVAAFLLVISFIFSFLPQYRAFANLSLLLTYFLAGIPALISSIEDIIDLEINIDVLMTLAAFLSVLIGSGREGGLLLVLFSFSGALEGSVRSKAKGAISSLKKLAPQCAYVVQPGGSLVLRSVRDIPRKTLIHVKAGEVIPLDGVVTEGASSVNLVHLTGENLPQTKRVGDEVPAGGRNLDGALTLEVTRLSSDSTLARIIQLITEAQESKPKLQRWLDKVSSTYAMTIIGLAFFFALVFPWILAIPYLGPEGSIYRSLAFLIAASPCALILAIPIAYLSAVSSCAKQGILLKGGVILDALAKCTRIAMDKTGTLTTGELICFSVETDGDEKEMVALAYALERSALHPIAQAISSYAEAQKIDAAAISDFHSVPGYGLEGVYAGKTLRIGHPEWIGYEVKREAGELIAVLQWDKTYALFRFHDQLRKGVRETLQKLRKKWAMKLIMLTGDHFESAELIAREAGIDEVRSDLKPEEKLAFISKYDNLAMVGDGINDAPALARASVGISMGKMGSKTAIDASDIVFLQDNIELLEWLVAKSHGVSHIVKQNLLIALGAIVLATLPALLGWIPLWLAVVLHEGGTVCVGLNALRLLRRN